jgi:hypothetical protein
MSLHFAPSIRKMIYTTNCLEALNRSLRKIIKTRGSFPNDEAALKLHRDRDRRPQRCDRRRRNAALKLSDESACRPGIPHAKVRILPPQPRIPAIRGPPRSLQEGPYFPRISGRRGVSETLRHPYSAASSPCSGRSRIAVLKESYPRKPNRNRRALFHNAASSSTPNTISSVVRDGKSYGRADALNVALSSITTRIEKIVRAVRCEHDA